MNSLLFFQIPCKVYQTNVEIVGNDKYFLEE